MKHFIVFATVILFGLTNCSSSQKVVYELNSNAEFNVTKAEYYNWIGGVRGAQGTIVNIIIDSQNIKVDSLYFRGKVIVPEVKLQKNNAILIIGNIQDSSKPELILHKDPKQEYGNQGPVKSSNFTFELESNEAVIRFRKNNKTHFQKVLLAKGRTKTYQ